MSLVSDVRGPREAHGKDGQGTDQEFLLLAQPDDLQGNLIRKLLKLSQPQWGVHMRERGEVRKARVDDQTVETSP